MLIKSKQFRNIENKKGPGPSHPCTPPNLTPAEGQLLAAAMRSASLCPVDVTGGVLGDSLCYLIQEKDRASSTLNSLRIVLGDEFLEQSVWSEAALWAEPHPSSSQGGSGHLTHRPQVQRCGIMSLSLIRRRVPLQIPINQT